MTKQTAAITHVGVSCKDLDSSSIVPYESDFWQSGRRIWKFPEIYINRKNAKE